MKPLKIKQHIANSKICKLFKVGNILIITLLMFSGCQKIKLDMFDNYDNCLPILVTDSIVAIDFKNVRIGTRIMYAGRSEIQHAGVCASKKSIPSMLDNQVLSTDIIGDYFYVYYNNLTPKDTYYFRSFIANDYGYAYSDIVKFVIPSPEPPYIPCSLPMNIITHNHKNYTVGSVYAGNSYASFGKWGVYAGTSSSFRMNFDFYSVPDNGIYNTEYHDLFTDKNDVIVQITDGFNTISIFRGCKVYVEKDSLGKYTISSCQLLWTPNGKDTLETQVRFKVD